VNATSLKEATRAERRRFSAKVARRLARPSVARAALGAMRPGWLRHVRPGPARTELLFAYDQQLQQRPRTATRVLSGGSSFSCSTDDVIPRRIYEFGVWEPFVSAVAIALLKPGDTFIDVGANVGYYSVVAASVVGRAGLVVAIEPMAEARAQLERHLSMNGADSARVIAAAVAPTAGEISLYRGPGDNLGRSTTIQVDDLSFVGTVPAAPLAKLVGLETLKSVSLMKIDIEGDELTLLRSLLDDCPDIASHCDILVELTPKYTELRTEPLGEIWRSLHDAGYFVYQIPNGYDVDFYLHAMEQTSFTAPRLEAPPAGQTDVLLTARDQESIDFDVPAYRARDASSR
jgi:FkbM family methyltransferase